MNTLEKIKGIRKRLGNFTKALIISSVLIIVGVAGVSIYKEFLSSKPAIVKRRTKLSAPSTRPTPQPKLSMSKVETKTKRKREENIQNIQKNSINPSSLDKIFEEVKKSKQLAYLYSVKIEELKKELEYLELKQKLKELKKQEEVVATIQQPDPRILELQKKIAELERRIKATGKKPSKSLKEKLEEFKKKLLAPPPLSTAKKTVHYKLIALLGKEALIERNGERITVRDGETLDGKKVRVESFAVRIGDKVLTLDFSQNEQKIPLPLPTPSFRRP